MVQSVETTPFSEDDAMQAGSMMAGLPPLLLVDGLPLL
jgi:MraZ protein